MSNPDYAHTAIVDTAYFRSQDRLGKAKLIVEEWVATYKGDDMGPLDLESEDYWRGRFKMMGRFHAREVTTVRRSMPERELTVNRLDDIRPGVLYRASPEHLTHRWSWTTDLAAAEMYAEDRGNDSKIWTCEPAHIFGRIDTTWIFPAETVHFTEWVIDPGDNVRPCNPTTDQKEPNRG